MYFVLNNSILNCCLSLLPPLKAHIHSPKESQCPSVQIVLYKELVYLDPLYPDWWFISQSPAGTCRQQVFIDEDFITFLGDYMLI